MDDPKKSHAFSELVLKFRDGQLDEPELEQFKTALRTSPEARRLYIETVVMYAIFQGRKSPLIDHELFVGTKMLDQQLWNALAEEESRAEPVEVEKLPPIPQPVIPDSRPMTKTQTPSKTLLFSLITSAAAIFLLILYIHYSPFKPGVQVAVLSDSIDAVWADTNQSMENGTPLLTNSKPLILREGYAQIRFQNQAQITLQAPAELQIVDSDLIKFKYGQIYSVVPPQAHGFQISTRHSKIIDLGTEFGIQQNINGDTEIHVLKGQVVFVSSAMGRQINQNLPAGSARRMSASTGEIFQIAHKEDLFVRHIDSASKWIWKGQPLSLADITSGGNGFHGGDTRRGIDLASGRVHFTAGQAYENAAASGFYPVREYDFVDGVFIPNGADGPVIVSTEGHRFDGFPETSGYYWSDITANPRVPKKAEETNTIEYVSTRLDVEPQADDTLPPRLLIHPNAGITFDLEKIRQACPDFDLSAFRAVCGLPEVLDFRKRSEFWVLVDGKRVFHKKMDYQNPDSRKIDIPLAPDDRFLTLAATDGGDGTHYDWCVFAQPYLFMQRR